MYLHHFATFAFFHAVAIVVGIACRGCQHPHQGPVFPPIIVMSGTFQMENMPGD